MKRRGRPPHPDILTPREWEVLALLRDGLSNPEIASRLGVTRDGVKYHVSQILWKLGAGTREEAAAWQPEEPGAPAVSGERLARAGRYGLLGAAGLALAGVATLAGAIVYSAIDGDGSDDSPATVASEQTLPLGQVAYVSGGDLWTLDLDTGEEEPLVRDVVPLWAPWEENVGINRPQFSLSGEWVIFHVYLNGDSESAGSGGIVNREQSVGYHMSLTGLYDEWSPTSDLFATGPGVYVQIPPRPEAEPLSSASHRTPTPTWGTVPEPSEIWTDGYPVTGVGIGNLRWDPTGRFIATGDAKGLKNDGSPEGPYAVVVVDTQARETGSGDGQSVTSLFDAGDGAGPPVVHSWSPDGTGLLFFRESGVDAADLISLPIGGEPVTLAQAALVPHSADWSPDGSAVAVVSGGTGGAWTGPDLLVTRPDGTQLATITDETGLEPAWSPDGGRIAYAGELEDGPGGNVTTLNDTTIWAAKTDGSGATELTTNETYADRYPQFSRDGSHILFVRLDKATVAAGGPPAAELWLMRADGSDQRKVADLPAIDLAAGNGYVDWTRYMDWHQPASGEAPEPQATATPTPGGPTPPALAPTPTVTATPLLSATDPPTPTLTPGEPPTPTPSATEVASSATLLATESPTPGRDGGVQPGSPHHGSRSPDYRP